VVGSRDGSCRWSVGGGRRCGELLDDLVQPVGADCVDERGDRFELFGVSPLGDGAAQLVDAAVEEPKQTTSSGFCAFRIMLKRT
jgi:hypothetical protein